MNLTPQELRGVVARKTGCTANHVTGEQFDYMGDRIDGCHECCGCEFGHGRGQENAGVLGDGFSVIMRGQSVQIKWLCPSCGHEVFEDCVPITAIDQASEIAKDPLCHSCRVKPA